MTDTQDYKPGDVANGHVLTEQHGWLPTAPAPEAPKSKKPIYKRWWAIGLAAIFVISGIGQVAGGSDEGKTDAPSQAAEHTAPKAEQPVAESVEESAEQPAKEPAKEPVEKKRAEPEMTTSQENAINSAENYLDFSAFSRKGLIDQLSSEAGDGFPKADAVFAVKHIDVDWNEQAAKSAKEYLGFGSFSRQGLIDQLSSEAGDGYTHAQAVYGVNQTGL